MMFLVTGADGFIGRNLANHLKDLGYPTRCAVRASSSTEQISVGSIDEKTNWIEVLEGVRTVIHCAARAHIDKETSQDPLAEYRKVNVLGTRRLAEQAALLGVGRLVFISSVGVHGTSSDGRPPFTEEDQAAPADPYAISKWEAEVALRDVSNCTDLETVIVRSPLVYGAGVQSSFLRFMKLVCTGIPLPFSSTRNARSLIGIDNLIEFLVCCSLHPAAANSTFLVSDGEDVSTPELVRRLSRAMGRSPHLFPSPIGLLRMAGRIAGVSSEMRRLTSSLQVDSSRARKTLSWQPNVSVDEGLRRTVAGKCRR